MKVLFAVSNEEVSESIVKKYQKEYKQILSYKNVYYFNAILKEIQKDKSYDRIVISEDLEAFTNTQYDQIDKFIFDKLDSISDEASNSKGNDTPIILICSDRRTKSEQMLVKLFGIGIYNAIIGNDRSVDEVCRLINRPRLKKEAKTYYKIDSEQVGYEQEREDDVSEVEIQNILAHYKRLGKNEEKYVESFNNIAAQYNDTQLRIITKFLPLNVRAVLEENSPKYQQVMSFNNAVSDNLRKSKNDKDDDDGLSGKLLKPKTKELPMSKPVVIPSAVNLKEVKKLSKTKKPQQNEQEKQQSTVKNQPSKEQLQKQQMSSQKRNIQKTKQMLENEELQTAKKATVQEKVQAKEEIKQEPKRGRGRPKKEPVIQQETVQEEPTKRKRGRPKKNTIPEGQEEIKDNMLPGFEDYEQEESLILPDVEENTSSILPGFEEEQEDENDVMLPGFQDEEEDDDDSSSNYSNNNYSNNSYRNVQNNYIANNYEQNNYKPNNYRQENNYLPNSYTNNNTNNNTYNTERYQMQTTENNYINTIDLESLKTSDKKMVSFVGTSKNGTSFIVNNIAELMSSMGINTAILDTTKNKNSYYIYTKNEEELRNIAIYSLDNLIQGTAKGISVNKNLTVFTTLPGENEKMNRVDEILQTLLQNYSLVLIDCDFDTPIGYFKQSHEIYLVQTLDILTIQPLTAFLRELKAKDVLEDSKLKIILNKMVKVRGVSEKTIVGGMAFFNDPAMSYMTELFDRNIIKYISIPFDEEVYIKYLEGIIECNVSLKGYSKMFMQSLKELGNMVYPLVAGKSTYRPPSAKNSGFTPSINNTLDQMKRNY